MRGQAPRPDRLEHVILEHELLGVGPVVGDVRRRLVAHHIRQVRAGLTARVAELDAEAAVAFGDRTLQEAVHLAAGHVELRVRLVMWSAAIDRARVVVGPHAGSTIGVRDTDLGLAVRLHGDAVGPGVGPEVVVEGAVLLHDDDDVLDLPEPGRVGRA